MRWKSHRTNHGHRPNDPAAFAPQGPKGGAFILSDQLLTVAQVSERLNISKPTLYKLLRSGQLASLKIGYARRIPEEAVERFIADNLETGVA